MSRFWPGAHYYFKGVSSHPQISRCSRQENELCVHFYMKMKQMQATLKYFPAKEIRLLQNLQCNLIKNVASLLSLSLIGILLGGGKLKRKNCLFPTPLFSALIQKRFLCLGNSSGMRAKQKNWNFSPESKKILIFLPKKIPPWYFHPWLTPTYSRANLEITFT